MKPLMRVEISCISGMHVFLLSGKDIASLPFVCENLLIEFKVFIEHTRIQPTISKGNV